MLKESISKSLVLLLPLGGSLKDWGWKTGLQLSNSLIKSAWPFGKHMKGRIVLLTITMEALKHSSFFSHVRRDISVRIGDFIASNLPEAELFLPTKVLFTSLHSPTYPQDEDLKILYRWKDQDMALRLLQLVQDHVSECLTVLNEHSDVCCVCC